MDSRFACRRKTAGRLPRDTPQRIPCNRCILRSALESVDPPVVGLDTPLRIFRNRRTIRLLFGFEAGWPAPLNPSKRRTDTGIGTIGSARTATQLRTIQLLSPPWVSYGGRSRASSRLPITHRAAKETLLCRGPSSFPRHRGIEPAAGI